MPINYETAVLMARRLPVLAWEIGVYEKAWEVIKNSGQSAQNIQYDLARDLTDDEKNFLNK